MAHDRVRADEQALGDFAVRQSLGKQAQHLQLTCAETVGRRLRRCGQMRRCWRQRRLDCQSIETAFAIATASSSGSTGRRPAPRECSRS